MKPWKTIITTMFVGRWLMLQWGHGDEAVEDQAVGVASEADGELQ